jgi:hypothetical protein
MCLSDLPNPPTATPETADPLPDNDTIQRQRAASAAAERWLERLLAEGEQAEGGV